VEGGGDFASRTAGVHIAHQRCQQPADADQAVFQREGIRGDAGQVDAARGQFQGDGRLRLKRGNRAEAQQRGDGVEQAAGAGGQRAVQAAAGLLDNDRLLLWVKVG